MSDLPEPLVPPDTDIRDLDGFMLNTERLMASELWAVSTGEEFKAAFGLWCRAWKQEPPGSLPNDERVLAAFSGAGTRWKKLREMALRGFVLCSDGRLYHAVLCDDVIRAARKKAERHERTRAATEARQRERNVQRNVEPDVVRNVDVTTSHRQDRDGTGINTPVVPKGTTRFPEFWTAYPRKRSKGAAEKAWAKLNPSEQLIDAILVAVKRATTSDDWRKDGGQFIPHPATWLTRRGWEDELAPHPLRREYREVI